MGHLIYGDSGAGVEIDDRALSHLQIVIIGKLRRGESFAFSWKEPASAGSGRSTIWLHPMVTLRFTFAGSRVPAINGTWLEQLSALANSKGSLHCLPEPAPEMPTVDAGRGPRETAAAGSQPSVLPRSSQRA